MNTLTLEETIQKCRDLEARAAERGFFRADCILRLNFVDHHKFWMSFDFRTVADDYDTKITFNEGSNDINALFFLAIHWLEEQDTPTKQRQNKFLSDLGHLVEEATFLEMDAEPLRNVFTAMTTNLLEHHT